MNGWDVGGIGEKSEKTWGSGREECYNYWEYFVEVVNHQVAQLYVTVHCQVRIGFDTIILPSISGTTISRGMVGGREVQMEGGKLGGRWGGTRHHLVCPT